MKRELIRLFSHLTLMLSFPLPIGINVFMLDSFLRDFGTCNGPKAFDLLGKVTNVMIIVYMLYCQIYQGFMFVESWVSDDTGDFNLMGWAAYLTGHDICINYCSCNLRKNLLLARYLFRVFVAWAMFFGLVFMTNWVLWITLGIL